MLCTNCGNQIPDGSTICPSCSVQIADGSIAENAAQAQSAPTDAAYAQVQPAPTDAAYAQAPQANFGVPEAIGTQSQANFDPSEAISMQPQANFGAPEAIGTQSQASFGAPEATGMQPQAKAPTFENALRGFSSLFIGQAIMVISSLATVASVAVAAVLTLSMGRGSYAAMSTAVGLISILAVILLYVAMLIRLVGLYQASKDDEFFKRAFAISIVAIFVNLLDVFINSGSSGSALSAASSIFSLVVFVLIFRGIVSIANKIGNQAIAKSGKEMLIGAGICYAAVIIIAVLMAISGTGSASDIVMSIAVVILAFVPDILLLVLLSKAKKMFV